MNRIKLKIVKDPDFDGKLNHSISKVFSGKQVGGATVLPTLCLGDTDSTDRSVQFLYHFVVCLNVVLVPARALQVSINLSHFYSLREGDVLAT